MKIESMAVATIKWGVILPVIGCFLMGCGVVIYAAAMIGSLGSAKVDVTTLRQQQ